MKTPTVVSRLFFLLLSISIAHFSQGQIWKKILPDRTDKNTLLPGPDEEAAIIKQLREDMKALTAHSMAGRSVGSRGEMLAGMYIGTRLNKEGVNAYGGNFKHPFRFVSGKDFTPETRFTIDRKFIFIPEDAFPAPFSAASEDNNYVLPESKERGSPWLIPLYTSAYEANLPDFDWLKATYSRAKNAIDRGASSVIFFDSYGSKYAPKYIRQSGYAPLTVPVIVASKKVYDEHIKNMRVMQPLYINIRFRNEYQKGTNIIGYLNNNAPSTIIIGAHYDGLGYGEHVTGNAAGREIFDGADDNASGVAAMLSLSRLIKNAGFKKYNYLFLAFSGSEAGLLGAKAFVEDPGFDKKQIALMVNLDRIGRLGNSRQLYINGVQPSSVWNSLLQSAVKRFQIVRNNQQLPPSDYMPFYEQQIPCLSFSTGLHSDYQKPTDDLQKINFQGEKDIVIYLFNLLISLEQGKAAPSGQLPVAAAPPVKEEIISKPLPETPVVHEKKPVTAAPETGSFLPAIADRIGITVDSTYDGIGVRISGTAKGRSASTAGLHSGDIILQIGGDKINGIGNFNAVVTRLAYGQRIPVKVKRGATVQTFNLIKNED